MGPAEIVFQTHRVGVPRVYRVCSPRQDVLYQARGAQLVMKGKTYTFFIASTPGKLKKLIVPAYVLHGIAVLAIIGGRTRGAPASSHSRMLWKVGNYNALHHDQQTLKPHHQALQKTGRGTT